MEQELLFDLLRKAVSPFACVQAAGERLAANGFEELCYSDEWKLKKGGKYIVNHHDTTLFAFTIVANGCAIYTPDPILGHIIKDSEVGYNHLKKMILRPNLE